MSAYGSGIPTGATKISTFFGSEANRLNILRNFALRFAQWRNRVLDEPRKKQEK